MSKRSLFILVAFVAVALVAPASAQTTTEVKNGTIVAVGQDSLVVRDATGTHRYFEVPSGFTVNVDGKETPVSALKPGMTITAAIKTVSVPTVVQTTELKNAKVIKNEGGLLYVREADGIHTYNIPPGFRFNIGGAKLRTGDLQVGQTLNATIVHTARGSKTEQEIASVSASDDAAKAAAAKAAAAKAAADKAAADRAAAERAAAERAAADRAAADARARADAEAAAARAAADAAAAQQAMASSLPKTASAVPLAGALGALCLGLGAALTLRRKRS
jgi:LPXTG-motif cell wall-anchored protein